MSALDALGGGLASAAVAIIDEAAKKLGHELDGEAIIKLAGEAAQVVTELVDDHAKKKAQAAGDAAADSITTEDQAEAELRKR